MNPTYYTLLIRDFIDSPWEEHFGDWDRETVHDEILGLIDGDGFGPYLVKIIRTDGHQSEIDKAVNHLNLIKGIQS